MTPHPSAPPRVIVVMGVTGTGKSTIAAELATRLGWDRGEGDDLHPPANVAKMSAGTPLTDDDRWPWLALVHDWIHQRVGANSPAVITCSALRRVYRDRLREPGVVFVHLDGDRATIANQLSAREDHFMPTTLLGSQISTLEPLEQDEDGIVVSVGRTSREITDEIIRRLGLSDPAAESHPVTTKDISRGSEGEEYATGNRGTGPDGREHRPTPHAGRHRHGRVRRQP